MHRNRCLNYRFPLPTVQYVIRVPCVAGEEDTRARSSLETLVWTPAHGLSDRQIDQFLVVARSVGTFARALDCSSSVKQPSLHMSAAAASRDITLVSSHSSNNITDI